MITILANLSALALAACSQPADDNEATAPRAAAPADSASIYEAALANENRPSADRDRDTNRKPAAVLEFLMAENIELDVGVRGKTDRVVMRFVKAD